MQEEKQQHKEEERQQQQQQQREEGQGGQQQKEVMGQEDTPMPQAAPAHVPPTEKPVAPGAAADVFVDVTAAATDSSGDGGVGGDGGLWVC